MVRINGEAMDLAGTVLLDVLVAQGYDPRRIAVECNEEIVPKAAYGERVLRDGDEIEVVRFVGGG